MERVVLITVHGTFARGAEWIKPGSEFLSKLEKRLANHKVHVFPFQWSGCNSHRSRLLAAEQLKEILQQLVARYPGSKQIIIAHSHGGNVALYATRSTPSHANLKGVACLATPFIHTQIRQMRFFGAIGILAYFVAMFLPVAVVIMLLGDFLSGSLLVGALSMIFIVLFAFLLFFVFFKIGVALLEYAQRRCDLINQDIEDVPVPFLSVRLNRDEASIWLKLMIFLSNLPERFWSLVEWALTRSTMHYLPFAGMGIALIGILAVVEGTGGREAINNLGVLTEVVFVSGVAIAFLPFVAAPLVIPVLLIIWAIGRLLRSGPFGFGEALLDNLLLHARVSDGEARVFTETEPERRRLFELRHSKVYEDDAVITYIADWLNKLGETG